MPGQGGTALMWGELRAGAVQSELGTLGQVGAGLTAPLPTLGQNGRRAAGSLVLLGNVPWRRLGAVGRLGQALPALGERLQWEQRNVCTEGQGRGRCWSSGEVIHLAAGWRGAFQVLPHLFNLCNPWHLAGAFHLEIPEMNTVITTSRRLEKFRCRAGGGESQD